MTMHDNPQEAAILRSTANINALCVKERQVPFPNSRCGIMIEPAIVRGIVASDEELYKAVETYERSGSSATRPRLIVVAGHGIIPGDSFVWRGTATEFRLQWRGD